MFDLRTCERATRSAKFPVVRLQLQPTASIYSAISRKEMPNIIIEDGAWGSSCLEDVRAVAQSVCDIFLIDAAIDVADSIIVRFSELHYPIALLDRGPNNEHIILVNAKDRRWSQLAYQFAHEYCHVFSAHYRVPLQNRFRWLEESLCETASLYAMLRMGEVWQTTPPYQHWASYAGSLTEYANEGINAVARFDTSDEFQSWLDSNIDRMTAKSVIRELNNVVAVRLLSYFQSFPGAWQNVTSINTRPNLSGDLAAYFLAWSGSSDEPQHIIQIANLMGI
jgi:hypothetical protein